MNYLKLPDMEWPVSVIDVCQAHSQLEADYNVGGIVWERPSNQRRNASTGVQLSRMKFHPGPRHVTICEYLEDGEGSPEDDDVRDIYLINVLKWKLPMDEEMQSFIGNRFTEHFLKKFPHWEESQSQRNKAAQRVGV